MRGQLEVLKQFSFNDIISKVIEAYFQNLMRQFRKNNSYIYAIYQTCIVLDWGLWGVFSLPIIVLSVSVFYQEEKNSKPGKKISF